MKSTNMTKEQLYVGLSFTICTVWTITSIDDKMVTLDTPGSNSPSVISIERALNLVNKYYKPESNYNYQIY